MTSLFISKHIMEIAVFSSYSRVYGDAIRLPSQPVTTTQVAQSATLLLLCLSLFVSACFYHESHEEVKKQKLFTKRTHI